MEQVQPSVKEMNYVIGVFDGKSFMGSHITDYTADSAPLMKYHLSWSWIMRVVEKIPKCIHAEDNLDIRQQMSSRWKPIENELCNVNIKNVHYCVYKFIQFYNQQKQSI